MSEVPGELKFTSDHEWIREEEDGSLTVGITDHAQAALGDLVFVELPEMEAEFTQGEACAVVESVKAASDVYSPVGGTVTAVNEALAEKPELINSDPYADGWLFKLSPNNLSELDELMPAGDYESLIEDED